MTGESARQTGIANEERAAAILTGVRGDDAVSIVDTSGGNQDPFGFADVIAAGPGKMIVVQVKTNRFTAAARRKLRERAQVFDPAHVRAEVWVRVDGEGWQLHRYDRRADAFEPYLETATCDQGEMVERFRDVEKYYGFVLRFIRWVMR